MCVLVCCLLAFAAFAGVVMRGSSLRCCATRPEHGAACFLVIGDSRASSASSVAVFDDATIFNQAFVRTLPSICTHHSSTPSARTDDPAPALECPQIVRLGATFPPFVQTKRLRPLRGVLLSTDERVEHLAQPSRPRGGAAPNKAPARIPLQRAAAATENELGTITRMSALGGRG